MFIHLKAAFGCVKAFPENISFSGNAIFQKRKMYSGAWLRTEFVLRKWDSGVCFRNSFYGNEIYGKSFPTFVFGKYFLENEIHFLQKIISHVWFVDHFTENNNFKHLHYLNKPVTIHKYSSKFKHLHCLNTSVTVQKYPSTST